MSTKLQRVLLGGFGGIIGNLAVFLPLMIAFSSGELLTEWTDEGFLGSLTENNLRTVWILFVALVFCVPATFVFAMLQNKFLQRWYAELPERKRWLLVDFVVGLVSGTPGGMLSARMGLRPGKLPTEILTASLVGLLVSFLGGFLISLWPSNKLRFRWGWVGLAIGLLLVLMGSTLAAVLFCIFVAISLFWPSNNAQVIAKQEAEESGPTPAGGDSPLC